MINSDVSTYEGRQNHIRNLESPAIETFENIYADRSYRVKLEFPEFTAVCPKTGLPDFGSVLIEYEPGDVCLELKSLKEYFFWYRDKGIFHENVVNRVCDDIIEAAAPAYLRVEAVYNVRGGITTTVDRVYRAENH